MTYHSRVMTTTTNSLTASSVTKAEAFYRPSAQPITTYVQIFVILLP